MKKKKKNGRWSKSMKKKERKKERIWKKKKKVHLMWLVSGRGSHEYVFNYKNVIGNWVMETKNT